MKKFTLLSTAILSLIMLGACASEKQKSSDTNPTSANTTDTSNDYSDNESSENNESSNEVPYYSSTNESSIKDHCWREDYNSKGEYNPVDEMTQEEIKKELEETLNDALGLE